MSIRHREVSRLEGFSDAVFGFALTLLVVQLEVPKTMDDLYNLVRGLLPFALMFAMVCWIWYEHNVFFRRYGLQDAYTAFLNSVLLFVVLFYVYPLKFLFLAVVGPFTMVEGTYPEIRNAQGHHVMYLYSGGVLAIFGIFVLLHVYAWRKRVELGLSESELLTLKFSTRSHLISCSLAVVSLCLAGFLPHQSWLAGMLYGLMGPLQGWNGYVGGSAHEKLRKATGTEKPA